MTHPHIPEAMPPDDAALWAALEETEPVYRQLPLFPDWPDDDDLETQVRRHGGRLPGSDPRR